MRTANWFDPNRDQGGKRLVELTCNKCGCQYAYELARTGKQGEVHSSEKPNELFNTLKQRLVLEAELVPCPHCHWINEDLVTGYRQSRFRVLGKYAAIIGLVPFFILVTRVILALNHFAPLSDQQWLILSLSAWIAGPLIAGALLAVQRYLRQQIQPNVNFPAPPLLPPGTPPSMVLDPATGRYQEATPLDLMPSECLWLVVQLGRHSFPENCCNCLQPTKSMFRAIGISEKLLVPLCGSCRWMMRLRHLGAWLILSAAGGLTTGAILWFFSLREFDFLVLWGLAEVLVVLAAFVAARYFVAPAFPKQLDAARGVFRIRFRNSQFPEMCLINWQKDATAPHHQGATTA